MSSNFFMFMQLVGKIDQKNSCTPTLCLTPPPLENPGSATAYYLCFILRKTLIHVLQTTKHED